MKLFTNGSRHARYMNLSRVLRRLSELVPTLTSCTLCQTNDGKQSAMTINPFFHNWTDCFSPSIHQSVFSLPSSHRNSCTYPSPPLSASPSSYSSSWPLMLPETLPSRKLRWARQEVVTNSDSFPVWILKRSQFSKLQLHHHSNHLQLFCCQINLRSVGMFICTVGYFKF